jgi:pimeloyl-ACP methyl ester carboxylesterase
MHTIMEKSQSKMTPNMSKRMWALPPGVKTLKTHGYDMAYFERGQGAPVVLVHGTLNDYRTWMDQIKCFSAHFKTIAVSLRHHYPEKWDGKDDDFSVRQHVDDLASFIKGLNAGPVHLVGHSRGGDVVLILAKDHPQLVKRIVLADPAPLTNILPKTSGVSAAVEKRRTFVSAALEQLQKGKVESGLEIFTDAVSVPGNWKNLAESAKQIRRDNAWSLKSLIADAKAPFTCEDEKKITAPVLLVTGDQSPGLYGMMHDALQAYLKKYQKIMINNASHGMYRDNPEAFNAAVMEFLIAFK